MESRTLTCQGQLVATAEVADTCGYDTDQYDDVFLFKNDQGYELLVVGRRERYAENGSLNRATVSVDLTAAPSTAALHDVVEARWYSTAGVWWQLLDHGREHDAALHAEWVPERMRRDLDASSVYDKSLALHSGYFGGQELGAPGRREEGWKERAVATAATLLTDRGWQVRPGPELSPEVEPGGLLSTSTEVLGSLWASRYGHEVAVVVRVDDCGEIYSRLADVADIVTASPAVEHDHPGSRDCVGRCDGLISAGDALERLLGGHLARADPGAALEL